MPPPDRPIAKRRDIGPEDAVLVLTDGSDEAERAVEWALVFAEISRGLVRRIDVVDCLDSGVIIRRYEDSIQNGRWNPKWRLPYAPTDDGMSRNPSSEPTIDVLHGVPHEVLLGYVTANAVESVIIGVQEKARLNRSFVGSTFARVSQAATVPVVLIGGETVHSGTRCTPTEKRDGCAKQR